MPTNLELKARVKSLNNIKSIIVDLGAVYEGKLNQIDTYFNTLNGRLKLREINGEKFELIFYRRKESTEEMWSNYQIVKFNEGNSLKEILQATNGIRTTIKKCRYLYTYQNCRIHLDEVEGLGSFLEIEVIYKDSEVRTKELFKFIKEKLSAEMGEIINKSYSDLQSTLT